VLQHSFVFRRAFFAQTPAAKLLRRKRCLQVQPKQKCEASAAERKWADIPVSFNAPSQPRLVWAFWRMSCREKRHRLHCFSRQQRQCAVVKKTHRVATVGF
jgi:hypothetical protein